MDHHRRKRLQNNDLMCSVVPEMPKYRRKPKCQRGARRVPGLVGLRFGTLSLLKLCVRFSRTLCKDQALMYGFRFVGWIEIARVGRTIPRDLHDDSVLVRAREVVVSTRLRVDAAGRKFL